jgi:hypothetical protein
MMDESVDSDSEGDIVALKLRSKEDTYNNLINERGFPIFNILIIFVNRVHFPSLRRGPCLPQSGVLAKKIEYGENRET